MIDINGVCFDLPAPDRASVHVLGRWQVSGADGRRVVPSEWRTAKTADLLRMLALQAGEPIAVGVLTAALWPTADRGRAMGSLRTAVSLIRRLIGAEAVIRTPMGLSLDGVWVDAGEFTRLQADAHRRLLAGDHLGAQAAGRRAVDLYRGDLVAHDDGAAWVHESRQRLARAHQTLLCDLAEAMLATSQSREAVDLAERALLLDGFSERASRLLMRAWFVTGERGLALREYERCRRSLADELGVDPSFETRAVHLSLLREDCDRDVQADLALVV